MKLGPAAWRCAPVTQPMKPDVSAATERDTVSKTEGEAKNQMAGAVLPVLWLSVCENDL